MLPPPIWPPNRPLAMLMAEYAPSSVFESMS